MSMDGFTAGVLLQAAIEGNSPDQVADLYKSLKGTGDGPPSPQVVELVTSWIGKPCKVKHTSHLGVVHGVNTSSSGFYPGSRFPVYVKITESGMKDAVGSVFEYDLDQVEITA